MKPIRRAQSEDIREFTARTGLGNLASGNAAKLSFDGEILKPPVTFHGDILSQSCSGESTFPCGRLTGILLTLILSLVLLMQSVRSVIAQGPCDEIVVDEAGVFGPKNEQVVAEAQKLVRGIGADVRVRTIKTFGAAGNLDNYVNEIQKSCKSWQAADGGRKNNLVVLIIAVDDRKTGLYYGSQWERALGQNWTRTQTDKMNPRFRDGDFAGGFIAGLKEIERLIDLEIHPPTSTPGKGPTAPAWSWVLIYMALAAACYFFYKFGLTYFTERIRRRAAQQKARLAKQATVRRITEWEEKVQPIKATMNQLEGQMAGEELKVINENLRKTERQFDRATISYSNLKTSAGDPDRPGLTAPEYGNLESAYKEVLGLLQEAETALSEINVKADTLRALVIGAPKAVETASADVESAKERIAQVTAAGFMAVLAEETLSKSRAGLDQARAALEKKCFGVAQTWAEETQQLAQEAISCAEGLPKQKMALEQAITELPTRIEAVKEKIIAGRRTFEQIAPVYAESCWDCVRGNGTEAENRINSSLRALEDARDCCQMGKQEWQETKDQIAKANGWLDECESLMRSITALKANLENAKHDSLKEIKAAEADISKARDYITRYDEDIHDSLETDLDQAQSALDGAKTELQKSKPDYLELVKLAKQANGSADHILTEARSEHEAMECLRQQATRALRNALAAVSRAKEYIEDHKDDVSSGAKGYLKRAQTEFETAKGAIDFETQITHAESAIGLADKAYSTAKANFAQTGRHSIWGSSPSSNGGSSWSSSGGGDSSSWSSSGGGSSDSGSSGGGGGSTGW